MFSYYYSKILTVDIIVVGRLAIVIFLYWLLVHSAILHGNVLPVGVTWTTARTK